jgi:hypothetical protein
MKPFASEHALRFTRALAMLGSLAALGGVSAGCGANVMPVSDASPDRSPPADSQALTCVCCPSGDLSGRCAVTSGGAGDRAPMPEDSGTGFIAPFDSGGGQRPIDAGGEAPVADAGGIQPPPPPFDSGVAEDASVTYLDPPEGQRWCTVNDLFPARPGGPMCAVPGPLPPPEMGR